MCYYITSVTYVVPYLVHHIPHKDGMHGLEFKYKYKTGKMKHAYNKGKSRSIILEILTFQGMKGYNLFFPHLRIEPLYPTNLIFYSHTYFAKPTHWPHVVFALCDIYMCDIYI